MGSSMGSPQRRRAVVSLSAVNSDAHALAVEQPYLGRPDLLGAVHPHGASQDHERRGVAVRQREIAPLSALQSQVPHLKGSEGLRRSRRARELAGDDAGRAATLWQVYRGDLGCR